MCQLLAMNCNVPTDICFSFTGFQASLFLNPELEVAPFIMATKDGLTLCVNCWP